MKQDIRLVPLQNDDREQFIKDNQEAFKYGATEEFGVRDEHFEEDGEIISRATIEQSIDEGEAYRIILDGQKVGGVIVKTERIITESRPRTNSQNACSTACAFSFLFLLSRFMILIWAAEVPNLEELSENE